MLAKRNVLIDKIWHESDLLFPFQKQECSAFAKIPELRLEIRASKETFHYYDHARVNHQQHLVPVDVFSQ
jgi:hypothetical protein